MVKKPIETELPEQDDKLYQAALSAEQDEILNEDLLKIESEMFKDGLEDESWD